MARITRIDPTPDSGLPSSAAGEIFDQIALFAGYGFNKSHAAAYAAISFRTAWLKTYHPAAFFAAAMNLDLDKVDEISIFATELKRRGLSLLAPDLNRSDAIFRPIGDTRIAYGLSAIRGVGQALARSIVTARDRHGPFTSIRDLKARLGTGITRTALLSLARSGALDTIYPNRVAALHAVETEASAPADQISMFDLMGGSAAPALPVPAADEILDMEFDTLGHYMSTHPLAPHRNRLLERQTFFSGDILDPDQTPSAAPRLAAILTDHDIRNTRAGKTMAVLTLSDPDGTYEALAFSEAVAKLQPLLKKKARLLLLTSLSERDGDRKVIVENAFPLPDVERAREAA